MSENILTERQREIISNHLTKSEQEKLSALSEKRQSKAIKEFVFFKAQGGFKGSSPNKSSPYQTAGPFFSNQILGQVLFPAGTSIDYLHAKLTKGLNDRHAKTRKVGEWRLTHHPRYGGFWSYRYAQVAQFRIGKEKRIINLTNPIERQSKGF